MLWQSGEARKRCKKDWGEMLADLFAETTLRRYGEHKARRREYRLEAEEFRESKKESKKKP
jgi:hypothetical protein